MLQFFASAGPFAIPMALLAVVVAVLAIINAIRLFRTTDPPPSRVRGSVDAILFWGAISFLLGLLGQGSGLLKMANALSHAHSISAQAVAAGFGESLLTTNFGLVILIIASLLWFGLRARIRRLSAE